MLNSLQMQMQIERTRKNKEMEVCMQESERKLVEISKKYEAEQAQKESLERRLQDIEDGVEARNIIEVIQGFTRRSE